MTIAQISEHRTLYDAVRDNSEKFEATVYAAVESTLIALGDGIFELEWANSRLRLNETSERLAA